MSKRTIAAFMTTLMVSALLIAQGTAATKLTGTVTAATADILTIKDKEGKSTMIMLDKATKYVKDKKAATTADIKVGTAVMVEAKMDTAMNMYTAQQVEVTATTVTVPDPNK